VIRFVLDGQVVAVEPGTRLLDACRSSGVTLPTLCHQDGLTPAGGCRLCLVEVRGLPRPVAACLTRAWEGMEVTTGSERLRRHRRFVVELLLSSGNHLCAACPADGSCGLQEAARQAGVDHARFRAHHPARPVDASRPRFLLDPDRCVLCTRCVRACAEQEGAHTLGVSGRGERSRIVADGGRPWGESTSCTDCGRCAEACPTGAILERGQASQGLRPRRVRPPLPPPGPAPRAGRMRLATLWLGGCSGCHMSLLDLDERLLALAPHLALVYSPFADGRDFPEAVDLCLVEGAVSAADHEPLLRRARERSRLLVAMGDCATSGGVTALRDAVGGAGAVLRRACAEGVEAGAGPPGSELPALSARVRAVHELVPVDLFLPGCPPPADLLHHVLRELAGGRRPELAGLLSSG